MANGQMLNKALAELGRVSRTNLRSKKAQKTKAMQTAAKVEDLIGAGVSIAAGAAAGVADGMMDGQIAGLTAGEIGSGVLAGLALSGALGEGPTKYLGAAAVGGLSYSAGRRAFEVSTGLNLLGMGKGGTSSGMHGDMSDELAAAAALGDD